MPDAHSQTSYRDLCKIKSQKVLPWWQNIPLTDYKPKQRVINPFRIDTKYMVQIEYNTIYCAGQIKYGYVCLYIALQTVSFPLRGRF